MLHLLDGVGQVDGINGDLNFADATKEICDEDTSRVPQKKVRTVARSGYTLTFGTYFELWTYTKTSSVLEKCNIVQQTAHAQPKMLISH